MPVNNFKAFSTANNVNVLNQADYEVLAALGGGFTAGKASSAQINKVLRQASVISSVLAQFIANSSGNDVLDNGDTATILANLLLAFNANGANSFIQISKSFSEIKAAGVSAQQSAVANLGLINKGLARFITSGSFTVPPGITTLIVSGCGAGAGGGGSQTSVSTTVAGSGGGGGGGFVIRQPLAVTPGQVLAVTIGTGGAGGAAGGGVGGAGGTTSMGSIVNLLGGAGGSVGQSLTNSASGGSPGAISGTITGGWGGDSQSVEGGGAYGGQGGASPFGASGAMVRGNSTPIAGQPGLGFGAGGGGAGGGNTNAAHTGAKGGDGAPGLLIIEW